MLNRRSFYNRIRARKIDVFKHTQAALAAVAMGGIRADSFRADGYDFTRLYIAHKMCADGIQRAGFGSNNIRSVIGLADAKRTKAQRIPESNQLGGSHNNTGICAFQAVHNL